MQLSYQGLIFQIFISKDTLNKTIQKFFNKTTHYTIPLIILHKTTQNHQK